jgi:hypothetical protein
MKRWHALAAAALVASMVWATRTLPASANTSMNACTITPVVSVQHGSAGFNTTILDSWAYPIPMTARPTRTVTVNQVLVCPPGYTVYPTVYQPGYMPYPGYITFQPGYMPYPGYTTFQPGYQPYPGYTTITDGTAQAPPQQASTPLIGPPGAAPHDTLRDLARYPARFDRQVVSLTGTVAALAEHNTDRGTYTTFELRDGGESVVVLVWGRAAVAADGLVRVTGAFHAYPPFAIAGTGGRPVLEAQMIGSAGGR